MTGLRIASLFVWIVGAVGLLGVHAAHGIPHVIYNYSFLDNGDPHNPFAPRTYVTCEFVGPFGVFRRKAVNGECAWFRMFKANGQ